jgi:hypothetical protein
MKLIKYTFALFVLGSAIVSCSKDDPEIIENEPEEKYMNIGSIWNTVGS